MSDSPPAHIEDIKIIAKPVRTKDHTEWHAAITITVDGVVQRRQVDPVRYRKRKLALVASHKQAEFLISEAGSQTLGGILNYAKQSNSD